MKRNNKKGFTIVEMTIVIAVIAILAAVLIPTFSSVVDKANQSADVQLIRQANVVLQAATADGSSLSEKDAIKELENNSIKLDKPSKSDCVFYYLESENRYVIFNTKTKKATYPEDLAKTLGENWLPTYDCTLNYQVKQTFSHEDKNNRQYLDTGLKVNWEKSFTLKETLKITNNKTFTVFTAYNGESAGALVVEVTSNNLIVWMNGGYQCQNINGLINSELTVEYHWDAATDTFTVKATQKDKQPSPCQHKVDMSESSLTAIRLGMDERTDSSKNNYQTVEVSSFELTNHDVAYGETLTLPNVTDNIDGYECNGWYTAPTDGTKLENAMTMPAADTTIYAQWNNNKG